MRKFSSFFVVTGPYKAGSTTVFNKLKSMLPERYPGQAFVFVDHLFDHTHPVYHGEESRRMLATSRLLEKWVPMNEVNGKVVRPALEDGAFVIARQYGFDVVRNALIHGASPEEAEAVHKIHHNYLVPARINELGIKPPLYFLVNDTVGRIAQRLKGHDEDTVRGFVDVEHRLMERYFASDTGQLPPTHITGGSIPARCEHIIGVIGEHLERKRLSLAA